MMTSQWQWQITVVLITCATWVHTEKTPLAKRDKSATISYSNHRMDQVENNYNQQGQSSPTLEFPEEKLRKFHDDGPQREHYLSFSHHPSKDMHEKFPSGEITEHQRPEPSRHGERERNRNRDLGRQENQDPQYYPRKGKDNEYQDRQRQLHTNQPQRHHVDDIISLEIMRQSHGQREDPRLFHNQNKNNFPMIQGTKLPTSFKNNQKYPTQFPNGKEGNFKSNEKYPTAFPNGNEGRIKNNEKYPTAFPNGNEGRIKNNEKYRNAFPNVNEGDYKSHFDNDNPKKYFIPSEPYSEFIPKHFRQEDGSNENNNYHSRDRYPLMADQNFNTMNNGANSFSHDGDFPSQSNERMRFSQNYAHFHGETPKEPPNTFKISQHTQDPSKSPNMNNEHFNPHNSHKTISDNDKRFPYHQDPTIIFRPGDHENNKQSQSRPTNNGHRPPNFQNFNQKLPPNQLAHIPIYIPGSVRDSFQNGNNMKEGRRPNVDSMNNPYFQEQGNRGITRPNTVLSGIRYDNLHRVPTVHTLREKPFFESNIQSENIQASPYYYRNGNRQIGFDENGFSAEGIQFIPSAKQKYNGLPNEQRNHNKQTFLPNMSGNYKYGAVSSMSGPQQHFNTLQQPSLNYQMSSPEKDTKHFRGNNVMHKGPGDLYNTDRLQQFHHMAGKPTHNVPMEIRHPPGHTMDYFNGGAKNHKYFNDPLEEALEQAMSMRNPQRSFYNQPLPQQYSYMSPLDSSTSVLKSLLPIGIIGTLGIAGLKLGLLKALFLSSLLKSKQNNISYSNYGTHYDGFEKIISSIGNDPDAQDAYENYYNRRSLFQHSSKEMPYMDSLQPLHDSQSYTHYLSANLPLNFNNHNFQYDTIAQPKSQYKEEYRREEDWKKAMHVD